MSLSRPRRLVALVLAVVALLAACNRPHMRDPDDEVGDPNRLPHVTLQPLSGSGPALDLATLEGPAVINAWASTCAPCRTELPIYADFARRHEDAVAMIGIDFVDAQPPAALDLAQSTGADYPMYADPDGLVGGPPPGLVQRGLPMLVLVDADGVVVYRQAIAIKSLGQLEKLVSDQLGIAL